MKKGKNGKKNKDEKEDPDPESAPTRKSHRKTNKVLSKKRTGGPDPDTLLRQAVEGDGSRTIIDIDADGNCLFRSISDQLYHDLGAKHARVRKDICDFIEGHSEEFSVFLVLDDDEASDEEDAKDFETYLYNMRRDGFWGGNLELVAASRMYGRNITVFSGGLDAFTISHGNKEIAANRDLLVSYHDNDHYNSVRDNKMKDPPPPPIRTFRKPERDFDEVLVDDDLEDDAPPETTTSIAPSEQRPELNKEPKDTKSEKKKPIIKRGQCPCGSGKKHRKCCASRARKTAAKKFKEEQSKESEDDEEDSPDMDGKFRVLHI